MNFFDSSIVNFFQSFSRDSWVFDCTINFISDNHIIKGGILLILLWWGWFKVSDKQTYVRLHTICVFIACFIGIIIGRVMALALPFRFRPMHDEALNFVLPYTVNPRLLDGWSSFPSDHALLFFVLAAGVCYMSKRLGIVAIIYATVFIGLPRIYLGLHYPTDILGGAFVGLIIVLLCNISFMVEKVAKPILKGVDKCPEYFYPLFFLISYQIADMFDNSRSFLSYLKDVTEKLF